MAPTPKHVCLTAALILLISCYSLRAERPTTAIGPRLPADTTRANRMILGELCGWFALGSETMDFAIRALTVFDDGSGPVLYAGGGFTTDSGMPSASIARWDGQSWSALGSGMSGPLLPPWVSSLSVFDDGGGAALYAGGTFDAAGGVPANRIAKWDGQLWSALGSGMLSISGGDYVHALTVFDDGSGPALYAGGKFDIAGGVWANNIARWNGYSWSSVDNGTDARIQSLVVFDDGYGPALYAGGGFTTAGGVEALKIARWDGSSWSALGSGIGPGSDKKVWALAVFDDGSGPALYAGGWFFDAGGVPANHIARWDGRSWSALGSGVGFFVDALTVFDASGGPRLYAGGGFTTAGGVQANYIARWNGVSWSALGSGMGNDVHALTVFDDGSGPALYAGGLFSTAGGVPASRIAKWLHCAPPPCTWDPDDDGEIGAADLAQLLGNWGPCSGCPMDFDNDGFVGASDLAEVLGNWGPCP